MVLAAERDGLLRPGGTIVEPTSGNTGVGLAIVAAQRGYRCHFVTTDKVAPEKIDLLRAYGAEVTVCPVAVPPDHPDSYYSTAERLVQECPTRSGPTSTPTRPTPSPTRRRPAPRSGVRRRPDHPLRGRGGHLRDDHRRGPVPEAGGPGIQVIAADPEGSVFSGGSGRPYLIEGVGEDFFPDGVGPAVLDGSWPAPTRRPT